MKGSLIPGAPPTGFNFTGTSLASQPFNEDNDVDPMANTTNLVDCMLVLALGLMMALVTAMNVNLYDIREILDTDLEQIEEPEEIVDEIHNTENAYIEMGMVYQDPTTGKTYVVQENGAAEETQETQDTQAQEGEGANGQ